jgi:hypothetical protein
MSPDMLRANACNGSLVSKLNKSSNLTGKNSYCILISSQNRCILMKYMMGLGKPYNSTFPPRVSFLPAALMSLTTCFQETPPRPRLKTPKVFYALKKDISL